MTQKRTRKPLSLAPRWARSLGLGRKLGRSRVRVALIALVILVPLVSQAPTSPTLASWNDQAHASATLSTITVAAPEILTCEARSGLLGANPRTVITWRWPEGSSYTVADNAQFWFSSSGLVNDLTNALLPSHITTTGPTSAGVYTTTYGSALLSGLLGGKWLVGVSTSDDSGWSSSATLWQAQIGPLGANPSCVPFSNS